MSDFDDDEFDPSYGLAYEPDYVGDQPVCPLCSDSVFLPDPDNPRYVTCPRDGIMIRLADDEDPDDRD